MTATPSAMPTHLAPEDIAVGQRVVVTARWILVAAGLLLAVWITDQRPHMVDQLRTELVVLIALAFGNFYLTLRLLRRRAAIDLVAYAASAADLVVITVLVSAQGGYASPLYIFYIPALLAASVAFSGGTTFAYVAAAIVSYGLIAGTDLYAVDPQVLLTRLAMFAAVAFCGHLYSRIEHDRLRDAARAAEELAER